MSDRINATVVVEQVRFYKNNWGIIVCSISSCKKGGLKPNTEETFKGIMPKPVIGNMYNVLADRVIDRTWGEQYNIVQIASVISFDDADENGKKRFLLSIFTERQVNNMYKTLDDPYKTLKDMDTASLIKVYGIQIQTATSMCIRFQDNYAKARIFVELEDYNLTSNMVDRLLKCYKSVDIVIEKVKNNPYILCTEVKGIGWKKADQIALSGDISSTDLRRIEAYILYILDVFGEEGCSWITPDHLLGCILETLGEDIPDDSITTAIHNLEDKLWWSEEKDKIGLQKYYIYEHNIAEELLRIRDAESNFKYGDWESQIKELEKEQGWEYTDEQMEGIKAGLEEQVLLIQGPAGTGKSSLVSAILATMKDYTFVQTALSGRAASRMSEITGEEGYTIHRLLGYPNGDDQHQKFMYHQDNPLNTNIIIVDEISMIDSKLFYYLLRAIPNGSKLIMLGDPGQLESIGAGNIAYDIMCSEEIKTIILHKIHRQAQKSAIITESVKVRNGQQLIEKDWVGEETRGELQDLHIKCYSDASNTFYEIMKQFARCQTKKDFNIMECQIVVPIKSKGQANTYNINQAIQEVFNPKKKQKEVRVSTNSGVYLLREGDKIINRKNNYEVEPNIFNGNLGIIKEIGYDYEESEEYMLIDFIGIGLVKLPYKAWDSIELGYAITCHSGQGSQWDTVIYGIDFSSFVLLTREQIYTAITRAKKMCYLIAQTGALRMAVSKQGVSKKQTHLCQCLHDVAHPKLVF